MGVGLAHTCPQWGSQPCFPHCHRHAGQGTQQERLAHTLQLWAVTFFLLPVYRKKKVLNDGEAHLDFSES